MFSAISRPLVLLLVCTALPCLAAKELRVCSDPNNLPYSNLNDIAAYLYTLRGPEGTQWTESFSR